MQTKNTTRRAVLLAGIATAPALASPALTLTGPDPIFAAIETNRKAEANSLRLAKLEDGFQPELEVAIDAAVDAAIDTRRSLAATVPTTPAGLCAYLDYLRSWSPDDFLFDGSSESRDFLESLHRAVHGMSGLRPMRTAPHAVAETSTDAELLALRPQLELMIRDYAALQAVDDWEADPDLKRWDALHDRMHPLVDRIMSHRPKTLAGLGMFMRAASLSYDDYERENDRGEERHGNLISAVCTFCGIEQVTTDHDDEDREAAS
jgi:hypothetical protein